MTTVAVRNGVMASDSQFTDEYGMRTGGQKIFRIRGSVLGVCGHLEAALVFLDWFRDQENKRKPDLSHESDFGVLELSATGLFFWTANLQPVKVMEPYYAVGSGAKLAMGAMFHGATAIEAVQAGICWDTFSSGTVQSMSLAA